jgi:hypothetical protein
MSVQNQHSDTQDEKTDVSSPPTYIEDNIKQDTIIVHDEEERKLLRKIDLQSVLTTPYLCAQLTNQFDAINVHHLRPSIP